jgi:hypothetical protein
MEVGDADEQEEVARDDGGKEQWIHGNRKRMMDVR